MILTKKEIQKAIELGFITIECLREERYNPNGIDVTLSNKLLEYDGSIIDLKKEPDISCFINHTIPDTGFIINPGRLYLGVTNEFTGTNKYVMQYEGKSSLGRWGVESHICAGAGDIGFHGYWTLEIRCTAPTVIYADMPIGQIMFYKVAGDIGEDDFYNGKYNNKIAYPQVSQYYKNFIK